MHNTETGILYDSSVEILRADNGASKVEVAYVPNVGNLHAHPRNEPAMIKYAKNNASVHSV